MWRRPGGNSPAGAEFSGRQMEAGRFAAGSSRALRLDPFSLPVRFEAADEAADGRRRVIDLHRERVVVRRSVRGMRMALNLPVAAFRGVAIRLTGAAGAPPTSIAVVLEHGDPALSLPLFSSSTSRRHRRRMAVLGPRAWSAASHRRARRLFARAVCAAWRDAHRSPNLAPPPAKRDRASAAFNPVAAPHRGGISDADLAPGRARNYCAELSARCSASSLARRVSLPSPIPFVIGVDNCDALVYDWSRGVILGWYGSAKPDPPLR